MGLIARLRRTGTLFLIGFFLILYVALGIVFIQQSPKQRDLEQQIVKLRGVVASPLPSVEKLKAEFEEVNKALAPIAVPDALDVIVGIARRSGIDVSGGKLLIPAPPGKTVKTKVGDGSYEVLPIKGIQVQGSHESVMAFISDLNTGKTLKTMVLKSVQISPVEEKFKGEEADRRTEFRTVIAAVQKMMADNGLSAIPNPINYAGKVSTNLMGDDPTTVGTVEGFPDSTTTAISKGYTGTGSLRLGYVLYRHDKVDTKAPAGFISVTYWNLLKAKYYYTCEADGTVRQFNGPDVTKAIEYTGTAESIMETVATVEIDLYARAPVETKPPAQPKPTAQSQPTVQPKTGGQP